MRRTVRLGFLEQMKMAIQNDSNDHDEMEGAPSATDALQFHLGFKRVEARIRAVPLDDLESINLEVPSTVATVIGAYPEVVALRADLEKLHTFDVTQVDDLRDFALGLAHVHGQYRAAGGPVDNVGTLANECLEIRDRFHADAMALGKRKLLEETRVAKLRGGTSYRMIAFDIVGLVELFLEKWETIEGKTGVAMAEIDQARLKANQLVAALGLREQAPPVPNELNVLRQQAYTLLVRSYNDTRNAIAFVRRAQGDVDEITPSLYAGRGRRTTQDDVIASAPLTALENQPAPSAAPGSDGVPVGYPGSSPLAGS